MRILAGLFEFPVEWMGPIRATRLMRRLNKEMRDHPEIGPVYLRAEKVRNVLFLWMLVFLCLFFVSVFLVLRILTVVGL